MTELRRNVRRFYAYRASVSNGFWLPVGILYLTQVRGFGLADVGLVMGAFTVAMVVAEVPTGYLGDRLGRRASLVLGNLVLATFMAAHTLLSTPLGYLGLYVFWAFGWAFRSGTADAWLYELLTGHGAADEFTRVRGRAATVQLTVAAVTAAAAGVLVTVGWWLPFLANAALALLGLPVLLSVPTVGGSGGSAGDASSSAGADDARGDDEPVSGDEPFSPREAAALLRTRLGRPDLRWLVVYAALFSGFYQVARDFEQPALDAAGVPVAALGVLYAGFKLASAGATASAGWLTDRLGVAGVLALLVPVYAGAFLTLSVVPLAVVPVAALNRSLGAMLGPVRNQYLNDRLPDDGRATTLSGVSAVLLLAGGAGKFLAGPLAAAVGLLRFLAVGGVAVAAVGGVLWVATSPVRPSSDAAAERGSLAGD